MKNTVRFCAAAVMSTFCTMSAQAIADTLRVEVTSKASSLELVPANASCVASAGKSAPGENRSLPMKWSAGPAGTQSYALTMVDLDVPSDLSTLNRVGKNITVDAPRMAFVHWVLANIPKNRTSLAEAADGDGHLHGGLPLEQTTYGIRGQNGFAAFLKDGPYGGYMGPCPPWNDELVHRYRVTVYALDVDRLRLPRAFTQADLLSAMSGHVVATGSTEVDYSVNPKAKR